MQMQQGHVVVSGVDIGLWHGRRTQGQVISERFSHRLAPVRTPTTSRGQCAAANRSLQAIGLPFLFLPFVFLLKCCCQTSCHP